MICHGNHRWGGRGGGGGGHRTDDCMRRGGEAARRRHVDVGHRLRGVAPAIGDGFDCLYGEGHGVEGESRKLEELRGRSAAGLALVGDDRWLSCYSRCCAAILVC